MAIVTTGTFDGVHTGHRHLLGELADWAKQSQDMPLVLVLSPHPLAVVAPERAPSLLSSPEERLVRIKKLIPEATVEILPFDKNLAALSHYDFLRMLQNTYKAKAVLVGHDNRFGSDRNANFEDYVRSASQLGMAIRHGKALPGINSSTIRKSLLSGDISSANDMLGYPYSLKGTVVSGHHIGRQIGFPTANLFPVRKDDLIPGPGVYAAFAETGNISRPAIVNIGIRPTFDDSSHPTTTIEAHLLDFDGDLYGQNLTLHFMNRLRDEIKFDSPDKLVRQLQKDENNARELLQIKENN